MARISSHLIRFTLPLVLLAPNICSAIPFDTDEVIVHAQEPAMADVVPVQTLDEIRDIMIKESIARSGPCACPYSTDALGGQCGTLSSYFYPWNKILCYRRDISADMVYFFRLQRGLNFYSPQQQDNGQATSSKDSKDSKDDQKAQTKPDPTADYFRNTAKPIPKTVFSSGAPSNSSLNFNNLDSDNLTPSGYYKNYSIPVSPVSNTTNLQAPPASAF